MEGMVKLVLHEMIDEYVDLPSLEEWFRSILKNVEIDVRLEVKEKWLILETENPALLTSITSMYTLYPLQSSLKPVLRTCWIEEIKHGKISYSYPSLDGSTITEDAYIDEWMEYLDMYVELDYQDLVNTLWIDVGYPINLTLKKPSILFRKIVEKLVLNGLDVILLRGLSPHKCENLLDEEDLRELFVDCQHLTLTTHIISVKIGVKLDTALEKLEKKLQSHREKYILKSLRWLSLEKIFHPKDL
ncbi:MAG: hypothetical protein QXP74_07365 [Nitrososphaerota archaeon]